MRKAVTTDKAPRPIGPYSQAIIDGDLLFLAGQGPLDPATGATSQGDVREADEDRRWPTSRPSSRPRAPRWTRSSAATST